MELDLARFGIQHLELLDFRVKAVASELLEHVLRGAAITGAAGYMGLGGQNLVNGFCVRRIGHGQKLLLQRTLALTVRRSEPTQD
ncbi:MAG: hypothetical protein WCA98_08675 [Candidatus Acidiferrales bacterium]